ncbi:hypothetical protein [Myceligenerans crystallogenes]|uniref:Uncharacterized protein n=1 Tax=Myceligenerans crystallogenes TaxID=316335 RepID=A0ABP4ZG01_9MICO
MRRPLRKIALAGILVLLVVMIWPVVAMQFDGPAEIPPRHVLPELPPGAEVVADRKGCGSGGCSREVVVRATAGPAALRDLPDKEACRLTAFYDWRPVCISTERSGDTVTFSLRYATLLD